MAKTSPAAGTPLRERLEKLAAFAPQDLPVLSLYLNLATDQHGRDSYDTFVRKALTQRLRAVKLNTPEHRSLERDSRRIDEYLTAEVAPALQGLALFACAGAKEFFEAIPLEVPIDEHALYIGATPHLYPLAHLADRYPRYAAVVLDTNRARIFVFSLGATERSEQVTSPRTRRNAMGGWSQARYQRHAENFHLHHVKEVVDTLDRIVRTDNVSQILIAGDEVVVPIVKEQLPRHLMDKLVDVIRLEHHVPDHEVLRATLDALHTKDAQGDAECVEELLGQWQASALGVVGPEDTLRALERGQVDQLVISANPDALEPLTASATASASGAKLTAITSAPSGEKAERVALAGELVRRAEQTGARIKYIEDPALLKDVGGVGALLRFRI